MGPQDEVAWSWSNLQIIHVTPREVVALATLQHFWQVVAAAAGGAPALRSPVQAAWVALDVGTGGVRLRRLEGLATKPGSKGGLVLCSLGREGGCGECVCFEGGGGEGRGRRGAASLSTSQVERVLCDTLTATRPDVCKPKTGCTDRAGHAAKKNCASLQGTPNNTGSITCHSVQMAFTIPLPPHAIARHKHCTA